MASTQTLIGKGHPTKILSEAEIHTLLAEAFGELGVKGKRLLFIIPDSTRTAPIPLFFRAINDLIGQDAKALDFLVALGTHPPMSDEALNKLVGITAQERKGKYKKVRIFNHEWNKKGTFKTVGHISADEIGKISNSLLAQGVDVTVNKLVFDYDQLIVCGPVFPHEVAGYSGGNKYFFPGISGPEVINLTHWLGALITNYEVIGVADTPVRRVIDRAAAKIPVERRCL